TTKMRAEELTPVVAIPVIDRSQHKSSLPPKLAEKDREKNGEANGSPGGSPMSERTSIEIKLDPTASDEIPVEAAVPAVESSSEHIDVPSGPDEDEEDLLTLARARQNEARKAEDDARAAAPTLPRMHRVAEKVAAEAREVDEEGEDVKFD